MPGCTDDGGASRFVVSHQPPPDRAAAPSATALVRHGRLFRVGGDHQPVADTGYGLDDESPAFEGFGQPPQLANRPVDGVVSHHPAFPALGNQIVARHDSGVGPVQGDQHLHDPGLQHVTRGVDAYNLPC